MSVSPLDRLTPPFADLAEHATVQAGREGLAAGRSFWPHLTVLTAFWIYVALSNVLYANSMQASLSSMKIEHVCAAWDARLSQRLLLYPLFLLSMWRSLRTGWRPLWRAAPIQLLCALGFAVLAFPALALGTHLLGQGEHEHPGSSGSGWTDFLAGGEIPTWIASATNFLVTYGFGLALVTGFAFYQRLRDSQLRSAALERALTQAHLAALRMQLSPHTLRVLNTIAPGRGGSGDTGIGLANVRERLAVQFGERASFEAGPADEHLWRAQIHMPLLRDGPDTAARPDVGAAL